MQRREGVHHGKPETHHVFRNLGSLGVLAELQAHDSHCRLVRPKLHGDVKQACQGREWLQQPPAEGQVHPDQNALYDLRRRKLIAEADQLYGPLGATAWPQYKVHLFVVSFTCRVNSNRKPLGPRMLFRLAEHA